MTRMEHWAERWLSGWGGLLAVLLVTLVLALPGFFTLPPVDRDEVLFAQSSRQMLQSGNFIDIRIDDQPRYKKPVGIYWLQAATVAITGVTDRIWGYRLVSLAGVLAAVGLTWGIGRRFLSPAGAVLGAMILGSCMIIGAEARLAKTDAAMLATILIGQWVLARMWLPGGRAQAVELPRAAALTFWVALALGILIKGPIPVLVLGTTLAGLSLYRRDLALWRALQPKIGLPVLALLVLPWVIAITITSQGAFWATSVGHDLLGKIGTGQENHGAPPGTYLAALWVTFWPGAMLLAAALPGLWALRRHPMMLMALVWVIPTWIVFELTTTKLPHYTLPTYPALALLVALAVTEGKLWPRAAWVPSPVPLALFAVLVVISRQEALPLPWTFWPAAALAAVLPALVPLALRRAGPFLTSGALAIAALGLSVAVYPSLARIPGLWPAKALAAEAAAHPGCALTVAGYSEPSLVFWTDRQVVRTTPEAALAALSAPGCQLVALPADAPQPAQDPVSRFTGMDLGRGRPLDLLIYLKAQ